MATQPPAERSDHVFATDLPVGVTEEVLKTV
eukprot:CAMPEP_0175611474 /NCGR_PEP_ID=MMETSP0096-20121207/63321_1 /TAXON_ID=311494 /ORGANISM="Alexandrium monilatum, Strain CCMP3105" /LENGTH=30 /DNA_ID= /DNA_START= /DNA_END= /DNA_ORIENTATION=